MFIPTREFASTVQPLHYPRSPMRLGLECRSRVAREKGSEHNRLVTVTSRDRDQDSLTTCAVQLFGALFAFPASSARSVARPGLFSSFFA